MIAALARTINDCPEPLPPPLSTMKKGLKNKSGIQLLIHKYRSMFRIPENQNHYSDKDYRNAERKFLKYVLEQRRIEIQDEIFK